MNVFKNPKELNLMITNNIDSGIVNTKVNADQKIKRDLLQKLREITQTSYSIDLKEKNVFEDKNIQEYIKNYNSKAGITLYPFQKQIVRYLFYASTVIRKNRIT